MEIYLDKVLENQKDLLFRLLQHSLYEESASDLNEINNDGIYEYKYFDSYFTEENRQAFIIREKISDKIVGFVMINDYVQKVDEGRSISEFMILPKYRKNGIGKLVAFKCFDMYLGNWEVSSSYGSKTAFSFWSNVINEYTNNNNKFEDNIFIFNTDNK